MSLPVLLVLKRPLLWFVRRFISDEEVLNRIRTTFTGLYTLDEVRIFQTKLLYACTDKRPDSMPVVSSIYRRQMVDEYQL